jgi:hypothetical protein
VPGDPDGSLLIRAIRYTDDERKMPPKRRLARDEVAAFEAWVKRGAPTSRGPKTTGTPGAIASPTAEHWAFRPPADPPVPTYSGENPVDAFIRARLEEHSLHPSPPADKATLIRRATYDLTGLPPTPEDVEGFLADRSPEAFAKVVERLLASPRYGERSGRHWLDLVRYCDDFEDAWRYRDWVVKAFNADLPYDQFIVHQIAGDLLPAPGPGSVNADGIVATTVLSLGTWGGIDRRKRLADIVDDQIDTTGRTFLGLTLACARCHDHKFDPISTEDYYGLAGIFLSTRVIPETGYLSHGTSRLRIPLVSQAEVREHEQRMARVREAEARLKASVGERYAAFAASLLPRTARYLVAAWDYEHRPAGESGLSLEEFAKREGLKEYALRRWVDYLAGPRLGGYRLLEQAERDFDGEPGISAWRTAAERPWWAVNTTGKDVGIETFLLPPHSVSINPGTEGGAVAWKSPVAAKVRVEGKLTDGDPHDGTGVAWAVDHESVGGRRELASERLANGGSMRLDQGRGGGRLASIPVRPGDVLYLQVALGQGDAHYDITNLELTISCSDGSARWDLARDVADDFLASNPHPDSRGNPAVWRFLDMAGSHRLKRMPAVDPLLARWWDVAVAAVGAGKLGRPAIEAAARQVERAIEASGPEGALAQDLTGLGSPFWVENREGDRHLAPKDREALAKLAAEVDALKAQAPPLPTAHGVQEGGVRYGPSPGFQDARVHLRGSYTRLGAAVPRRFPKALARGSQPSIREGSGRLELARWVASPDNPLTARVMVNRIWQHHFGEGLVRTPSNFGKLGEAPAHPELLDHLAGRFVRSCWSVKATHRLVMLSATYQQSSRATDELLRADPENRLFGRMNRRRLEAEAVRDSLLALSGRLDARPGGPPDSNPSSRRRLFYLSVSRSDRSDFGSLFDRANPSLHVEKRTVSTAAPQALHLMNNAFVMEQAQGLADRPKVVAEKDAGRRIAALHLLVFGHPATEDEEQEGRDFIAAATGQPSPGPAPAARSGAPTGLSPWAQYAQALLLSNEFLFVD